MRDPHIERFGSAAKQGAFSAEQLAKVLSWSSSNQARTRETARYKILREMPEYEEGIKLLKSMVIPQDENGSNVSPRAIQALPSPSCSNRKSTKHDLANTQTNAQRSKSSF